MRAASLVAGSLSALLLIAGLGSHAWAQSGDLAPAPYTTAAKPKASSAARKAQASMTAVPQGVSAVPQDRVNRAQAKAAPKPAAAVPAAPRLQTVAATPKPRAVATAPKPQTAPSAPRPQVAAVTYTPAATDPTAHQAVYLIKGLAGFQTGVVDLGEKLRKRGIYPHIEAHGEVDTIADAIIRRYKGGLRAPIILFGYSLGADAAGGVARRLYEVKIPVALMIVFGPMADVQVPPNVARAFNYFQSTSAWRGRLIPMSGNRAAVINLNLDNAPGINHFTIVSAERYQNETIAKISALVARPRKSAEPRPASQAAAEEKPSTEAPADSGAAARSN